LLFPQPFGPTMLVIPAGILRTVLSQNDLKPRISIRSKNSMKHYIPWLVLKSPQSIAENIGNGNQ